MGATPSRETVTLFSYFRGSYEVGLIPLTKHFFGRDEDEDEKLATRDGARGSDASTGVDLFQQPLPFANSLFGAGESANPHGLTQIGKESGLFYKRPNRKQLRAQLLLMRKDPAVLYSDARDTANMRRSIAAFLRGMTRAEQQQWKRKAARAAREGDERAHTAAAADALASTPAGELSEEELEELTTALYKELYWQVMPQPNFTEDDLDKYLELVEEALYETDADMVDDWRYQAADTAQDGERTRESAPTDGSSGAAQRQTTRLPRGFMPIPCALCLAYAEGKERAGCFSLDGRNINIIGYFGCMTAEMQKAFKIVKRMEPEGDEDGEAARGKERGGSVSQQSAKRAPASRSASDGADDKDQDRRSDKKDALVKSTYQDLFLNTAILTSAGDRTLERVLVLASVMLRQQFHAAARRVFVNRNKEKGMQPLGQQQQQQQLWQGVAGGGFLSNELASATHAIGLPYGNPNYATHSSTTNVTANLSMPPPPMYTAPSSSASQANLTATLTGLLMGQAAAAPAGPGGMMGRFGLPSPLDFGLPLPPLSATPNAILAPPPLPLAVAAAGGAGGAWSDPLFAIPLPRLPAGFFEPYLPPPISAEADADERPSRHSQDAKASPSSGEAEEPAESELLPAHTFLRTPSGHSGDAHVSTSSLLSPLATSKATKSGGGLASGGGAPTILTTTAATVAGMGPASHFTNLNLMSGHNGGTAIGPGGGPVMPLALPLDDEEDDAISRAFLARLRRLTLTVEAASNNYSSLKSMTENFAFLHCQVRINPDDAVVTLTELPALTEETGKATADVRKPQQPDTPKRGGYGAAPAPKSPREADQTAAIISPRAGVAIRMNPTYFSQATLWASCLFHFPARLPNGRWVQYKLKDECEQLRQVLQTKDTLIAHWRQRDAPQASRYLGPLTGRLLAHVRALQEVTERARSRPASFWEGMPVYTNQDGRRYTLHRGDFGVMLIGVRAHSGSSTGGSTAAALASMIQGSAMALASPVGAAAAAAIAPGGVASANAHRTHPNATTPKNFKPDAHSGAGGGGAGGGGGVQRHTGAPATPTHASGRKDVAAPNGQRVAERGGPSPHHASHDPSYPPQPHAHGGAAPLPSFFPAFPYTGAFPAAAPTGYGAAGTGTPTVSVKVGHPAPWQQQQQGTQASDGSHAGSPATRKPNVDAVNSQAGGNAGAASAFGSSSSGGGGKASVGTLSPAMLSLAGSLQQHGSLPAFGSGASGGGFSGMPVDPMTAMMMAAAFYPQLAQQQQRMPPQYSSLPQQQQPPQQSATAALLALAAAGGLPAGVSPVAFAAALQAAQASHVYNKKEQQPPPPPPPPPPVPTATRNSRKNVKSSAVSAATTPGETLTGGVAGCSQATRSSNANVTSGGGSSSSNSRTATQAAGLPLPPFSPPGYGQAPRDNPTASPRSLAPASLISPGMPAAHVRGGSGGAAVSPQQQQLLLLQLQLQLQIQQEQLRQQQQRQQQQQQQLFRAAGLGDGSRGHAFADPSLLQHMFIQPLPSPFILPPPQQQQPTGASPPCATSSSPALGTAGLTPQQQLQLQMALLQQQQQRQRQRQASSGMSMDPLAALRGVGLSSAAGNGKDQVPSAASKQVSNVTAFWPTPQQQQQPSLFSNEAFSATFSASAEPTSSHLGSGNGGGGSSSRNGHGQPGHPLGSSHPAVNASLSGSSPSSSNPISPQVSPSLLDTMSTSPASSPAHGWGPFALAQNSPPPPPPAHSSAEAVDVATLMALLRLGSSNDVSTISQSSPQVAAQQQQQWQQMSAAAPPQYSAQRQQHPPSYPPPPPRSE